MNTVNSVSRAMFPQDTKKAARGGSRSRERNRRRRSQPKGVTKTDFSAMPKPLQ